MMTGMLATTATCHLVRGPGGSAHQATDLKKSRPTATGEMWPKSENALQNSSLPFEDWGETTWGRMPHGSSAAAENAMVGTEGSHSRGTYSAASPDYRRSLLVQGVLSFCSYGMPESEPSAVLRNRSVNAR